MQKEDKIWLWSCHSLIFTSNRLPHWMHVVAQLTTICSNDWPSFHWKRKPDRSEESLLFDQKEWRQVDVVLISFRELESKLSVSTDDERLNSRERSRWQDLLSPTLKDNHGYEGTWLLVSNAALVLQRSCDANSCILSEDSCLNTRGSWPSFSEDKSIPCLFLCLHRSLCGVITWNLRKWLTKKKKRAHYSSPEDEREILMTEYLWWTLCE